MIDRHKGYSLTHLDQSIEGFVRSKAIRNLIV